MLVKIYLFGSAIFVAALIAIGCVVNRKEGLGHRVKLGILNSLLLGFAWPITMIVIVCALAHDCFMFWKRL